MKHQISALCHLEQVVRDVAVSRNHHGSSRIVDAIAHCGFDWRVAYGEGANRKLVIRPHSAWLGKALGLHGACTGR